MRNFHRDFESLNEAYASQVQPKYECTLNESVTDDIATKHREGSLKSLREALRALAKAHHEDYSNVTMEDVYSEMKMYAEENLPTHAEYASVPTGPDSPIHNPSPMGIATEEKTVDEELTKAQEKLPDALKKKIDSDHKETKEEGKEKVEEMTTHNIKNSLHDDEDHDHYEKTGEIRKKKKDDEEKKVGENFEQMLEIMRLSDQAQTTSNDVVEEEMYDCIKDYMGEGLSYTEAAAKCSGRGYEESVQSEEKEHDEDHDKEDVEEEVEHEKDHDEEEVEEAGAEQLGGVVGSKDAAFSKGLDAAFDIQAKVSAERNPLKRLAMSKDAKKVTRGVNKYMTALTGKLVDMTKELK